MLEGCAIEASTAMCVSASLVNESDATVGQEYFFADEVTYCGSDDPACKTCVSADSNVCTGASGCVCIYECAVKATTPSTCVLSGTIKIFTMSLFAVAVLVPLVIMWRVRGVDAVQATPYARYGIARLALTRRGGRQPAVRRTPPREPGPMDLKLETWRNYIEQHGEHFSDLELKSCYLNMDNATNEHEASRDSCHSEEVVSSSLPETHPA